MKLIKCIIVVIDFFVNLNVRRPWKYYEKNEMITQTETRIIHLQPNRIVSIDFYYWEYIEGAEGVILFDRIQFWRITLTKSKRSPKIKCYVQNFKFLFEYLQIIYYVMCARHRGRIVVQVISHKILYTF